MTGFIVLGAAISVMVFFILCIVFRTLASAITAVWSAIGKTVVFAVIAALILAGLFMLIIAIEETAERGFGAVAAVAVPAFVIIVVLTAVLGSLVKLIFREIVRIISQMFAYLAVPFYRAAGLCERVYARSLNAIVTRLDKH